MVILTRGVSVKEKDEFMIFIVFVKYYLINTVYLKKNRKLIFCYKYTINAIFDYDMYRSSLMCVMLQLINEKMLKTTNSSFIV